MPVTKRASGTSAKKKTTTVKKRTTVKKSASTKRTTTKRASAVTKQPARRTLKKTATKVVAKKTQKKVATAKVKQSICTFSSQQKEQLLSLIREIVDMHRHDHGGLKSLYGVARILDRFNQQYKEPTEKFDAILKFGMTKVPDAVNGHFYVMTNGREVDVEHLYELLSQIGKGKLDFAHAKEKMLGVYGEAPNSKK